MTRLSPAQRTASTARIVLTAGALFVIEALARGSAMRTAIAGAIVAIGGGLLFAAKRSACPSWLERRRVPARRSLPDRRRTARRRKRGPRSGPPGPRLHRQPARAGLSQPALR